MNNLDIINTCVEIWGSVLLTFIFICMFLLGRRNMKVDRLYLLMIVFNIVALLSDVVATVFEKVTMNTDIVWIAKYLSFASTNLLIYFLVIFTWEHIRRVSGVKIPKALKYIETFLLVLSLGILTVNRFYPVLFHISDSRGFFRMALFPIIHATYGAMLIIDVFWMFLYRKLIGVRNVVILYGYLFLAIATELIPRSPESIKFDQVGMILVLLILYVRLQAESEPKWEAQKKELSQNKANVLVNQIQPDLLFKSLNVIHKMSETEPKKAGEAVNRFASYLRENMDNLTRTGMIPFSMEMDHTQDYIYFLNRAIPEIRVDMDLASEEFLVPSHSVQPLISLLVRNDFTEGENGVIEVKSYIGNGCSYISIFGNGKGTCLLDGKLTKEDRQIISDIEYRLKVMCGGRLQSDSSEDGTWFVLTVPDPKKERSGGN